MRRIPGLMTVALFLLTSTPVLAFDFKVATLAPEGTGWMNSMRAGASEIAQRTDGRVGFKFYPGGAMGNDKSVLRKIRAGQLHGGALTGGGLTEVYPDNQIYSLPFLFRSYEELDYVRARMDQTIIQGLAKQGYVSFGLAEGGFAYFMSKEPVRTATDLKGLKVWAPEGDVISRTMLESLGVSPIPLPLTDVLTGLETGLITTIGASPSGAIALQWHTKVKYITDTPVMYFYGTLVIDKRAFDKISGADQAVVREVMERVFAQLNRDIRADNQDAREALKGQGIEFVSIAPEELEKLRALAGQAVKRLADQGVYTQAMYKTLQQHLDAYRHQQADTRARP